MCMCSMRAWYSMQFRWFSSFHEAPGFPRGQYCRNEWVVEMQVWHTRQKNVPWRRRADHLIRVTRDFSIESVQKAETFLFWGVTLLYLCVFSFYLSTKVLFLSLFSLSLPLSTSLCHSPPSSFFVNVYGWACVPNCQQQQHYCNPKKEKARWDRGSSRRVLSGRLYQLYERSRRARLWHAGSYTDPVWRAESKWARR